MALSQSNRLIRMTRGPVGPDEVVVTSFSGREAISRPFDFEIEFLSTHLDLRPGKVIGTDVALELDRRDGESRAIAPRHIHGYVNRFAAGPVVVKADGLHKYRRYRAGIVPWLWFLSKTARCYLFFPDKDEKSVFEIIEAVLKRAKDELHVDPVNDLQRIGDLRSRKVKHCVQYRETDFNFLSRTLEKYGVFYYFRFEKGKHTLVFDMRKNYPSCQEAEATFPRLSASHAIGDHITDWQHAYSFVSGKWTHADFNYDTPSTPLRASAPRLPSVDLAHCDKYEVYDYPGAFDVQPDGESVARLRQEAEEVQYDTVEGSSTCRTFTPGHKFKLLSHPDEDAVTEQKKSYLLTAVMHSASQPSDDTGDTAQTYYSNTFTCVSDSIQFRPQRITPRPVMGVQTAEVVGPPGEQIYTDDHGRVKVQFYWDREGKKDGKSSCWIRCSHPWAGKGWGSVSIPRIGQEVIVDFLEGDPDQPIIIGRVYNGDNMAAFSGGVVSGLKSNTHKGTGYNEMSMDDTAGKEKITIHGQYDMSTTVLHDQTASVKNNRSVSVDGTLTETIKKDTSLTVTEGNLTRNVNTGTSTTTVKGDITVKSTAGAITISSDAQHIYVHAATSIQLQVGASMIWMDSAGQIGIEGVNISIKGASSVTSKGGIVHSEADSEHQTKGAIVLSEGSATNTVKGGMVMLNP